MRVLQNGRRCCNQSDGSFGRLSIESAADLTDRDLLLLLLLPAVSAGWDWQPIKPLLGI
jgi:hypothetical protein